MAINYLVKHSSSTGTSTIIVLTGEPKNGFMYDEQRLKSFFSIKKRSAVAFDQIMVNELDWPRERASFVAFNHTTQ